MWNLRDLCPHNYILVTSFKSRFKLLRRSFLQKYVYTIFSCIYSFAKPFIHTLDIHKCIHFHISKNGNVQTHEPLLPCVLNLTYWVYSLNVCSHMYLPSFLCSWKMKSSVNNLILNLSKTLTSVSCYAETVIEDFMVGVLQFQQVRVTLLKLSFHCIYNETW